MYGLRIMKGRVPRLSSKALSLFQTCGETSVCGRSSGCRHQSGSNTNTFVNVMHEKVPKRPWYHTYSIEGSFGNGRTWAPTWNTLGGTLWSGGRCRYSSKIPLGCWRCGNEDPSVYTCTRCGTIQPPKDCLNAYALFGLDQEPYKFDISLDELEQKYKMLQKTLHPDKFSSASEEEKKYSAEQAALINRAYATLRNPLTRGSHLISLVAEGRKEDEEGSMMGGLPHHSEMLESIMEFREDVEDAVDEQTLKQLKEKVDEKINRCIERLKDSFDATRNVDQAIEELRALRYLVRMQEAVVEKL